MKARWMVTGPDGSERYYNSVRTIARKYNLQKEGQAIYDALKRGSTEEYRQNLLNHMGVQAIQNLKSEIEIKII